MQPPAPWPADREVVPLRGKAAVDPEYLRHRPQIEGRGGLNHQRGDPMVWHESHDSCHRCHFPSGSPAVENPAMAVAGVARTPTHPCPASKGATVPLSQTIQFNAVSAQALYCAYLSSA